jgi:hypothetical protein
MIVQQETKKTLYIESAYRRIYTRQRTRVLTPSPTHLDWAFHRSLPRLPRLHIVLPHSDTINQLSLPNSSCVDINAKSSATSKFELALLTCDQNLG